MIMMKKIFIIFLSIVGFSLSIQAQKKDFKIHTVAFYNLENLFDTINDPLKFDESSPIMELKTNKSEAFKKKIDNMAKVISEIGLERSNNSPVIIGVSEIENRDVLEVLINNPSLLSKDYGIVHYDSPDSRGIDVALLYQKKFFKPLSSKNYILKIFDDTSQERVYTRDQLLVSGQLEGDPIHIIVNHWPSRRGGEEKSRPFRIAAAKLNKHIIDSIQSKDPYAKILSMGDFNDDPINDSMKKTLKTEKNRKKVGIKGIYNPYEKIFKDGSGTLAYRDNWNLFDQILMSKPFLEQDYSSFRFYRAGIFNKSYLINQEGPYKGYPYRSFAGGGFIGGYSDHFPVYIYLIKELNRQSRK